MMKRKYRIYGLGLLSALLLSSCITTTKTARTLATSASIKNATVADLRVTDHRVTYTMSPSKAIQRGGLSNVKQAAIQEALTKNGNADVMVEPEFVIEKERTLFGSHINSITVTGRPAYYQNFRTLPDSVWHKPGFYGQPDVVRVCSCNGDDCDDFGQKRGGIAGLVGKLSGKSKNKTRVEREETDWLRSGMGAQLDFVGGYMNMPYSSGPGTFAKDYNNAFAGGLLTVGVNLTSHWFVGVGSGFYWDFDVDSGSIPIFGDLRFNFSGKKRSTWYMDYKIGGTLITNDSDLRGGIFLAPCFGYDFGAFEVGVQFMYNQIKYKDAISLYGVASTPKWDVFHIGLCLGISL